MFSMKRVYDPAAPSDGFRVLVDRLWPRGLLKEKAKVDFWIREIAPSDTLRKWFHQDLDNWPEFCWRYESELRKKGRLLGELREMERTHGRLTLLFAASDLEHNNALVLFNVLSGKSSESYAKPVRPTSKGREGGRTQERRSRR